MRGKPLERRDALKIAAGAVLLSGAPGCASSPRQAASVADVAARLDPAAADAILANIDKRLASLGNASLPADVLPLSKLPRGPEFDRELEASRSLVRKAVRTLYLTGRFLDMPDEMKVHPGVQSRVWAMQSEMDDAVLGMTERLERMTPDEHRRVRAYLEKDELFGERLAKVIESTARDDGLSFQRTFGVRSSVLHMSRRMSAQPPGLVIDPLISKVRRIEAHPRSNEEESRRMAARVGEQAFWEHQARVALLHQAWTTRLGPAGVRASMTTAGHLGSGGVLATTTAAAGTIYYPEPKPSAGSRTVSSGGIIMGFGLGSVLLGLIFAGLASATATDALYIPAVVLGVTVGPILLVVGLIVVIVGAIIKATE